MSSEDINIPNALEVHWADFHNMSDLLALEDSVSPAPGHACDIEQLGSVDHVVIYDKISLAAPSVTEQ